MIAAVLACGTVAAGSLVAVTGATAKASGCPNGIASLRTGDAPALAYAPPQLAAAGGYLQKQCISLAESPVAGAAILLAEVEAGQADFALLNPAGIITAVEAGIQLKIIAPNSSPGDFAVCVAKSSNITKITQLAGKSVATTLLGSNTDIAFRVRLARAGVNINNNAVHFVQILPASIAPAIVNGTVTAGQCNEPALSENLPNLRIIDQDPMAEVFGKDTPATYAVTTASFYASHKAEITGYQKAYVAMAKAVTKNPNIVRQFAVADDAVPAAVAKIMRLPGFPTTYAYPQLLTQLKTLENYHYLKPLPAAQLKALFVPLPAS